MFGETRKQPQGLADLLLWFGLVDDGLCCSGTALCWLPGSTEGQIFIRQRMRRWPRSHGA